jgi:HSP20 family protein
LDIPAVDIDDLIVTIKIEKHRQEVNIMAITQRRPITGLSSLRWDSEDWITPWFMGTDIESSFSDGCFCPNMESYTRGNELHLRAELPGVSPKDVDISVDDIHLCIKGQRKPPDVASDSDYGFEEMSYGGFERCFHIPRDADVQKMHAQYDNGLLDIIIPLSKAGKERHIPIEGVTEEKK